MTAASNEFTVMTSGAFTAALLAGIFVIEFILLRDRPSLAGHSDFDTGAAMMLKGLTAQYLLRRTFRVERGHAILIHAAAGGVGSILTQWAKHLGATVIGTVGSPEKARLALENGCDDVINYRTENFAARVKEITHGEGCHVVYDGVGKDTFPASLDCLKPRGMWVSEMTATTMPGLHSSALAPVAQWIERCPPEAEVAGSNPAGRAALEA